jgi:hypothetical protein
MSRGHRRGNPHELEVGGPDELHRNGTSGSGSGARAALLGLQREAGNAAVTAMIEGHAPGVRSVPIRATQRQAEESGTDPAPSSEPTIRRGSTGAAVVDAQLKLDREGAAPPLMPDGVFGPRTAAAVVTFQQGRKLVSDGVIGPKTWAVLDAGGPVPDDPLDCGCLIEDEEADVLELTPDAREDTPESTSIQALEVQRDPVPKKKTSTPVPASCSADARACFSISRRRAWLLQPGRVAQLDVPALGGRKGHSTPQGHTFKVIDKDANHHSSKYKDPKTGKGAPMPHYVHFAPQVGFHAGSLGTESHGCVHLSPRDAKTFFDNLNVGDRVDVVP